MNERDEKKIPKRLKPKLALFDQWLDGAVTTWQLWNEVHSFFVTKDDFYSLLDELLDLEIK